MKSFREKNYHMQSRRSVTQVVIIRWTVTIAFSFFPGRNYQTTPIISVPHSHHEYNNNPGKKKKKTQNLAETETEESGNKLLGTWYFQFLLS